MLKMKSKKSLWKRIKIMKDGSWKRRQASNRHNAGSKETKQKRQLRGWVEVSPTDHRRLKDLV